ncbi:MAG: hypothetical protein IJN34_08665 [Clostridia bacterium]|nr:hypothetical protein [Clostridia bacterium]
MSPKQQRQHWEQKKKKKFLVIALLLLVLILLPLCTVATYTWLAISKTPKISDMEMTINSNHGLELAWSADAAEEDWQQQLDFTDAVDTEAILLPVTWSDAEKRFFTARFGTDGRMIDTGIALSDEMDINSRDGHYIKFTLYGRTGEDVSVGLVPGVVSANGENLAGTYLIGTPLWDAEEKKHTDGGHGAQYATRIGLNITKLDGDGRESGPSTFYIYEPNADQHIDGSQGILETPSVDGTESLAPPARLIRQQTFRWQESAPIERGVLAWRAGNFEGENDLFDLSPEEKVKIDIYIWLEGKDADCVNALGRGAQIAANIQFAADADSGSGLVPIP